MEKLRKNNFLLLCLVFINVLIFSYILSQGQNRNLKVSFLDVGQGDAILIEAPNGREMLIDGGRDSSVINELGRSLGFFDRTIDIVLATHPDSDHIGGLPMVFDKYSVDTFIDSVADTESSFYDALMERVRAEDSNYSVAKRGMVIILDDKAGVYIAVLYPDADDFTIDETNELSTITKLIYGDTSFMLTGDAGKMPETKLFATDKNLLDSTVLKAGHHGSKTSSAPSFVRAVSPEYAIISAGADNSYGHPHAEVVETLTDSGAQILETSKEGTVTFISNGVDLWLRK